MRELTKSMLGFSWAVGLFGFQQLTKMMTSASEPSEVTIAQLDDVAHAAERHLSDSFAGQFRAGDEWQRRVVDALFDAASLRSFDPRSLATSLDPRPVLDAVDPRSVIQGGVDLFQRSVSAVKGPAESASSVG